MKQNHPAWSSLKPLSLQKMNWIYSWEILSSNLPDSEQLKMVGVKIPKSVTRSPSMSKVICPRKSQRILQEGDFDWVMVKVLPGNEDQGARRVVCCDY